MEVYYSRCLIEGNPFLVAFDYGRPHCCDPKIGRETRDTNKPSSESSMDQIQYGAMWERSIM